MKRKLLLIIIAMFSITLVINGVYAATATITANKTSVTVGTKVTITVKVNAAAWNLKVSGSASDSLVGFNMDAVNQTTTKTYTLNTSKAGTYKVSLSGDITDQSSDSATAVSSSVTVTVKEKTTTTNTNQNSNTNTTTTKKSSNANISKLALSVEGLSFKKNQTTYSIKVGEDVEDISVNISLESNKAKYKVTGNKDLKAGNNVIKIVVTAEDGTKKTYKINVEKKGNVEDSSAELANLIVEDMTFTTPFTPTVTEYEGSKMKYAESLNILPYTVSEKAEYEIIGNKDLKEGQNTIVVKVTSYDETSIKEYKLTFEMLSKEETNALQIVEPDIKENNEAEETSELKQILIDNSTIILLYILALIEFAQVVYLYIQLKSVNPEAVSVTRRRNKNKDNK